MLLGPLVLLPLVAAVEKSFSTVSITASAPWVSDPVVEAATLVNAIRGSPLVYWQAWLKARKTCDTRSAMRCALAALDATEGLHDFDKSVVRVALAARTEAPTVAAWAQLA